MVKHLLIQKLKRLILIRLLIVAFFLTLGAILFQMSTLVYYGILSAFLGLSLIYSVWLVTERALRFLMYFQIIVDLASITLSVYYTGGVDSVLATLYVLPILSAGFVLFPNAALSVAGMSSALFVGIVALSYSHHTLPFLPPSQEEFQSDRNLIYCAYMTYVRVTIFIMIGFLTEYWVQVVGRMERSLKIKDQYAVMGEMAVHLAHEIKNPLTSISGSVELLQDDLSKKLTPENQKLMEAIVQESQRVKTLFDEVLDYAKPETLDVQRLKAKEVLDEVFLILETLPFDAKGIRLHKDYENQPEIHFDADRSRIKQVFINIILNGLQAMAHGGDLRVKVLQTATESQIVFKDTGQGMSRKVLANLFVPFHTHKNGGIGIGLAIAHKIVRNHGGRIKVKSRLGHGSTFTVLLPRSG